MNVATGAEHASLIGQGGCRDKRRDGRSVTPQDVFPEDHSIPPRTAWGGEREEPESRDQQSRTAWTGREARQLHVTKRLRSRLVLIRDKNSVDARKMHWIKIFFFKSMHILSSTKSNVTSHRSRIRFPLVYTNLKGMSNIPNRTLPPPPPT